MKQTIRINTFETNSSSLHTLTITDDKVDPAMLNTLRFNIGFGAYGWEKAEYTTVLPVLEYLWTMVHYGEVDNKYIKLMKEWLPNCTFDEDVPVTHDNDGDSYDLWKMEEETYIDHAHAWFEPSYDWETGKEGDKPLIDELFADKQTFANVVLGSRLATWNDNDFVDSDPDFLEPKDAIKVFFKGN